jgi:hypothetical protein
VEEPLDKFRAQRDEILVLIAFAHPAALFFNDRKNLVRRIDPPGNRSAHDRAQIILQPAARAIGENANWEAAFKRHGKQEFARFIIHPQLTLPIGQAISRELSFAGIRHGWKKIRCWIVPSQKGRIRLAAEPFCAVGDEQRARAIVRLS